MKSFKEWFLSLMIKACLDGKHYTFVHESGIPYWLILGMQNGVRYPSPETLKKIFDWFGTDESEQKEVVYMLWKEKLNKLTTKESDI